MLQLSRDNALIGLSEKQWRHWTHAEVVGSPDGTKRLAIKVLDRESSGIYVCVSEPWQNGTETRTQSVVLLRRKDPDALLKGRETFREFAVCPVIGGSESTADSYGGD